MEDIETIKRMLDEEGIQVKESVIRYLLDDALQTYKKLMIEAVVHDLRIIGTNERILRAYEHLAEKN